MLRDEVAEHYRQRGYNVHENVRVRGASGAIHAVELLAEGRLGHLAVAFEDEGGFEGPEMGSIRRVARDIGATPVVAAGRLSDRVRRLAPRFGVVLLGPDDLRPPLADAPRDAYPSDDGLAREPWPERPVEERAPEVHPWPRSGRARPAIRSIAEATDVDTLVEDWTVGALAPRRSGDAAAGRAATSGLWRRSRAPAVALPPAASRPPHARPPPSAPSGRFGWLRPDEGAPGAFDQSHTDMDLLQVADEDPPRPVRPVLRPAAPLQHEARPGAASAADAGTTSMFARPPRPSRAGRPPGWVRWAVGPLLYGAATGIVLFLLVALFL